MVSTAVLVLLATLLPQFSIMKTLCYFKAYAKNKSNLRNRSFVIMIFVIFIIFIIFIIFKIFMIFIIFKTPPPDVHYLTSS